VKEKPYPELPILILDDDPSILEFMRLVLAKAGIDNVVATDDGEFASDFVKRGNVSLVFLDLLLVAASGEALLNEFVLDFPQVPVIVITGTTDTETIVRCVRSGAIDYIVKPIEVGRLLASVWNGLSIVELKSEMETFRARVLGGRLYQPEIFEEIVTCDERMVSIFRYIEAIGKSRHPVLITGATGTGKELFARAVHRASGRSGPFVAINVGGLDDSVFADSLFGHRRGAYTGADSLRSGFIKEAAGGTLFLDEIGDLEPRSQIKLLRLLQEGEYYPLGADVPLRSDARIVAATTHDLAEDSRSGAYRKDLFYRLQTHPIAIPTLMERKGDIPLLVDHFIRKSAAALKMPDPTLPQGLLDALMAYDYPGNVRELESLIHDAAAGAAVGDLIRRLVPSSPPPFGAAPLGPDLELAPEAPPPTSRRAKTEEAITLAGDRFPSLREAEEALFRMAIERASGNLSAAATLLGISRQTLYKRMKSAI
jgi:DNA-binding NtrC family response regulator